MTKKLVSTAMIGFAGGGLIIMEGLERENYFLAACGAMGIVCTTVAVYELWTFKDNTKRIRLYGIDVVALIVGFALLWTWVRPVLGMSLVVVSTIVGAVVAVINSRIPR